MVRISINRLTNNIKELSIELTHKCALNCVYCSSESNLEKSTFLNLNRIKKIIEEVIEKFNLKIISLSGGETFLYPHFKELINFLNEKDLEVIIYTSGIILDNSLNRRSLSEEILKVLSPYKKNTKIVLNIQGHSKELIEKINKVQNSFNLIQNSILKLIDNNFILEANIVPFKYNYKYIKEITNFCLQKGFKKINFLRFVPQGRGNKEYLYNSKKEFKKVIQELVSLLKIKNMKNKIRIGHPMNFLFLLSESNLYDIEENHYCRGGFDAPLILPNGDVSMCPAWKNLKQFSAGNIYDKNFEDIWFSKNFEIFRNFIKQGYKNLKEPCQNCNYLNECRGKCVAQRILSKNSESCDLKKIILIAPDPQCFK